MPFNFIPFLNNKLIKVFYPHFLLSYSLALLFLLKFQIKKVNNKSIKENKSMVVINRFCTVIVAIRCVLSFDIHISIHWKAIFVDLKYKMPILIDIILYPHPLSTYTTALSSIFANGEEVIAQFHCELNFTGFLLVFDFRDIT